jgi:hypothetical protein
MNNAILHIKPAQWRANNDINNFQGQIDVAIQKLIQKFLLPYLFSAL